MFCDHCYKKEATIFLTQIVEGEVQKMNFCEACAEKQGVHNPAGFAFAELLLGFGLNQDVKIAAELTCSVCELTATQLKKTGRLGCGACYDLFIEELAPMIRNMQPNLLHVGKVPRLFTQNKKRNEVAKLLQEALRKAIDEEDYETAAQLRDKIVALQVLSPTTHSTERAQSLGVQKLFPFEATTDGSSMKKLS